MAPPEPIVVVTGSPREASDLVEALARRGLVGRAEAREVEVLYSREPPRRVLADLAAALETWLEDGGRERASVRVGTRLYLIERGGLRPAPAPGKPSPAELAAVR